MISRRPENTVPQSRVPRTPRHARATCFHRRAKYGSYRRRDSVSNARVRAILFTTCVRARASPSPPPIGAALRREAGASSHEGSGPISFSPSLPCTQSGCPAQQAQCGGVQPYYSRKRAINDLEVLVDVGIERPLRSARSTIKILPLYMTSRFFISFRTWS